MALSFKQHAMKLETIQQIFALDAEKLKEAADLAIQGKGRPLSHVKLLAPVPRPPRIFGIGLNYASHAVESQMKTQSVPTVFIKLTSSVTGNDAGADN